MEVKKITRSYDRTIEVKRPDGTSVWLKHGASIEAELRPEDVERLSENFTLLQEIVISEVNVAIKKEKEKVESMFSKPAHTPTVSTLNDLPKTI